MTCSHHRCALSPVELKVSDIVSELLDDNVLERVGANGSNKPTPDFESARHAVEVKALISPSRRSYEAAHKRHLGYLRHHPIASLRHVWFVTTDITEAADSYEKDAETPDARGLIRSLTPLLEQMEERGLTNMNEHWSARGAIANLIGFGMCYVAPPGGEYPPGILMNGHGWGYGRTNDPERDVVLTVQQWLDSSLADNLRDSLTNRRNGDALRVAALVPDGVGPASAIAGTLAESPDAVVRTPPALPDEVDAVVLVAGDEVLDFGLDGRVWRRRRVGASLND